MKVLLVGDKSLVQTVSVTLNEVGLSVTINTVDRWLPFQYVGGWCHGLLAEHIELIGNTQISCFQIEQIEGDKTCNVILVPEDEIEVELLNGTLYENQNKDEICILLVKTPLLMKEVSIARVYFPSEQEKPKAIKNSFLSLVVGLLPKFPNKSL